MRFFVNLMTQFIEGLYQVTAAIGFPSYALAIIFLGIIVRLLLFPLTLRQMKSTIGMSEVQPELRALQERYANNKEKLSEEMAKLYQAYEINPAAGCLPILIQMPILYTLFRALREFQFSHHASFFWIDSLNDPDPYYILPILLAVLMFFQQKLAMAGTTGASDNPMMKGMLYTMPLMMGFVALQFPSGLCLYWVTTSTLMIGQQAVMNRLRKKELAARAEQWEEVRKQREKKAESQRKRQKPSKKKSKAEKRAAAKSSKKAKAAEYLPPSQGQRKSGFDPNNPKATYRPPK